MESNGNEAGELETLSRDDLLKRCKQLLAENQQLQKQTVTPATVTACDEATIPPGKKRKKEHKQQRPFDFSKYGRRKIAFKFLYLGWGYQGLAAQENTKNTVEEELFAALIKGRLIEKREGLNYSRCGRTDKGVSAFGQVIALDVRSNKPPGSDGPSVVVDGDIMKDMDTELPYVQILNRLLPPDIRVVAYTPVPEDFDARFSCKTRVYKYYFPAADLDIVLMHQAAQKLTGEKDFRNFCKVDVGNNVNHFIRNIVSFSVKRIDDTSGSQSANDMCEIEIVGLAFLWHQVRCMVAVLMLIGLRLEQPDVLDHMLDVERCPKKPQYNMASELPLVLYDCRFDNINWIYDNDFNETSVSRMVQMLTKKSIETTILRAMCCDLQGRTSLTTDVSWFQTSSLLPGFRREKYKELRERAVCEGLERHLEIIEAKRIKLEEKYAESKEQRKDIREAAGVGMEEGE